MKLFTSFLYIFFIISLTCCVHTKYVPIETKIIQRDTLIKLDSIIIKLPIESKNNSVPYNKKSIIENSLAISEAYLDSTDNQLKHSLKNKPQTKLDPDTVIKFEIKEVYKEIPVEVVEEVPYIPNWAFVIMSLGVILAILKLKSLFK